MVAGLRAMGPWIDEQPKSISISPRPLVAVNKIDVGNAGTVMRFLPPLAALALGDIAFDGDARSHERPLAPVIKALIELGADIDHGGRFGLPLIIHGSGSLKGGEISIDASASSQFVSALLLAAPRMDKGLTVKNIGPSLPSAPHIEMTVAMLRERGIKVDNSEPNVWKVSPGEIFAVKSIIEPDLSNAAPFMVAAMIAGGSVTILDWPTKTTQPGDQLRWIFTQMGANLEFSNGGLTVTGSGYINGIDIDLNEVGELTPSIAALAALASSPSHLRGIGHLRLHETDRLNALASEINGLGGDVIAHADSLEIKPRKLHGGTFHTYEDHRLATAGAIIGLAVKDVYVENIETTKKTIPDFTSLWTSILETSN
jgi:3-phosphoshikimate 1-carboxyvinyltransferase